MKEMNNNLNVVNEVAEPETVANAVVIAESERNDLSIGISPADLMNPAESQFYCSIDNDGSVSAKAKIFNALNSPEKKVAEMIGEEITIKDIAAHVVDIVDDETGEYTQCLRVVLIDENGVGYEAVSGGIANAVQRILSIFGQPNTWEAPIKVKVRQKQTRNGNNKVNTLEVIG